MEIRAAISLLSTVALITFLVVYGFRLFAEYHSRGKWAKNVTSLLAGLGLFMMAASLLLSPRVTDMLTKVARTHVPAVLLWASNTLLLAAIAAFGIITYARPLRLWHERKIERELNRELPNIP